MASSENCRKHIVSNGINSDQQKKMASSNYKSNYNQYDVILQEWHQVKMVENI